MTHAFGGSWTRTKIAILEGYISFYTQALKNQPFVLHYADAFAGTGTQTPKYDENQPSLLDVDELAGSVKVALDNSPCFSKYHFNDKNPVHVEKLLELSKSYPSLDVSISDMDANDFVEKFCASLRPNDRAVLLVDPYSTQFGWNTLRCIAKTKKIDLFFLFPISVTLRMTPRDGEKIKNEWKQSLNKLLGTDKWQESLYRRSEPLTGDLFGDFLNEGKQSRISFRELESWVTNRLREIFPYVEPPRELDNNGRPLFLFYFAVSNPDKRAWGLAKKASSHVTSKKFHP